MRQEVKKNQRSAPMPHHHCRGPSDPSSCMRCWPIQSIIMIMRWCPLLLLVASVTSCQGRSRHRALREALEESPDAGASVVLDLADCEITSSLLALNNLERVRSLSGHRGRVEALALSDAGEFLAAGGADGVIRVWDARSGKLTSRIETRGEVRSIVFRPATTVFAAAGASPEIELWDAKSGERRGVLRAASGGIVTAVAYDSDASLLASGSLDGSVCLWNSQTSTEVYTFHRVGGGEVRSLSFSPDGSTLAVVSGDGGVRVIDTNETRAPADCEPGRGTPFSVRRVTHSPS